MITMGSIAQVIDAIKDLAEDTTLPKNIKIKLQELINLLQSEDDEVSLKVNKALHELDEISSDANIQSYTRTQLLGIASALEMVE